MNNKNTYSNEVGMSALQSAAKATESEYIKEGYFFPSDDIDPQEKKGAWSVAVAQAIWALFIQKGAYSGYDDIYQMRWLRMYGAGAQPKQIYMDMILENGREGWMNTDWNIFSPISKFKRIIFGRFGDQSYEYQANSIDPISCDEKEKAAWEVWYQSNFGDQERSLMEMLGLPEGQGDTKFVATSLEELNMVKEMGGFKIPVEMESELLLEATDFFSNPKQLERNIVNDLIDFNKAAIQDIYDPISGLCKYEYRDFENLVIDYSRETDFKDIRFWGYLSFRTINEVRLKTGLSEVELQNIIQPWYGRYGNMSSDTASGFARQGFKDENGNYIYNNLRVPTFIYEYLSTDTKYKTKKGDKFYDQDYGKVKNTDKKKTVIFQGNNVYAGEWIVGSKVVMEDGLKMNVSRQNPKEPRMSLHAVSLPGKSIVEAIIPNLDQIQLTKLKLQNAIAVAKPQGLSIEVGSMENIDLGDDLKSPLQLISLARQTGDVLYRATTHAGSWNNSQRPIDISLGGLGPSLNEFITLFELNFNFISELSGIDRRSAASPTTEAESATAAKIATAATSDALKPLFTSYIMLKEYAGQSVLPRIQRAIKTRSEAKDAYMGIIGNMGVKIMEFSERLGVASIGIKIQIKPNEAEKQAALEAVSRAMQPGQDGASITVADWLYLVDLIGKNKLKQARAIMQYRLNVSREEQRKLQSENMQLSAKSATDLKAMEIEKELKKIKAEEEKEIRVLAAKALFEGEKSENDMINKLREQLILQALQPEQQAQSQPQPKPMQ